MMSLKVNTVISFFILINSSLSYADQTAYPNVGSGTGGANQVGEKKVNIKGDKSSSSSKSSSSKGVVSNKTSSAKTFTSSSHSVKIEGKAIPTTNNNNHSQ